jgi:SOS-response transcriptional repressor LexA
MAMYKDTRRQNLQRLISEVAQGNQAHFSEMIGKSPSYMGQLARGVGSFGERVARQIEEQTGKPKGWLDRRPESNSTTTYSRQNGLCPVLSWVAAGSWQAMETHAATGDEADEWMSCPVQHGAETFVLRVRGESMYNPAGRLSFADGDLIFVDPAKRPENKSCVVVRREDEQTATFKQLVHEGEFPQQRSYLKPLNPQWPEPIIELTSDARLCGVVIFKGMAL